MADIIYAQKCVIITQMLITDFDDFFGDEQTRNKSFQRSMIIRKKNFKKIIREELNLSQDLRQSEQNQCLLMSKQP